MYEDHFFLEILISINNDQTVFVLFNFAYQDVNFTPI